jgi:hypothetical protein
MIEQGSHLSFLRVPQRLSNSVVFISPVNRLVVVRLIRSGSRQVAYFLGAVSIGLLL